MSLEDDLAAVLKPLVGNRVSPVIFPQPPRVPTWPAIRYTPIDSSDAIDACGNGDEPAFTHRIQLDIVASTFTQARALRLQVIAALRSFDPPAVLDLDGGTSYDAETETYRAQLDYTFHGSS